MTHRDDLTTRAIPHCHQAQPLSERKETESHMKKPSGRQPGRDMAAVGSQTILTLALFDIYAATSRKFTLDYLQGRGFES